jgi:hypothetical protein
MIQSDNTRVPPVTDAKSPPDSRMTGADSPVMLVNDRTMCSFMSNDKLDQLIDGLKAEGAK